MAIKELFNDARPQVLFDPRASQRIDPRFKFTRDGIGTYTDADGIIRTAPVNQPRFDHDPTTGRSLGLLVEEKRTNSLVNSEIFTNWNKVHVAPSGPPAVITPNVALAPDGKFTASSVFFTASSSVVNVIGYPLFSNLTTGVQYTFSVYLKVPSGTATVPIGIGEDNTLPLNDVATLCNLTTTWQRFSITTTKANGNLVNGNIGWYTNTGLPAGPATDTEIHVWGAQFEQGSFPTSYIPTAGIAVTREPDLLSVETPLPSTGSIYIDARSFGSDVDTTLLTAAPASPSTDKLALAIREPASLYNSKALVYEVDGAFKPTLPFPVPSNAQERNLITYGANNYHYRSDSARYTPSSSSSVPANMTRLGIGHDVTDPTKAMTGYINAVYLWPGEITPTVAEALVRGDVDPKDADAGTFTPETGALAFAFNTQGTATDGDRVVQLPVSGSTNNILVDWGDNTSSSFIGAAASSTVSHTYSSAGIYPVQITADDDGTNSGLENIIFYNSAQRNDLVRVLQWGGTTTFQPTTMYRIFRDCVQLDFATAARTNLPDTSAVTNWQEAFYGCASITGTFPTFDTSAATTFGNTWRDCSGMTAFAFIDSANVTNMQQAWQGCSSLTSFPLIDTSAATNLSYAWSTCSSLTSFPLINTGSATTIEQGWANCGALTSFPAINTANVTNMNGAWSNCGELTTFPLIDTAKVTAMSGTWLRCRKMTSFPLINTANVTNMSNAWYECETLASMPLIDTSKVTNLSGAWFECFALTSFPLLNTAACTNFFQAWQSCSSLTSFPLINTAAGTNFSNAWINCNSLTSFPLINTAAGTNFSSAWQTCSSLTSFPLIDTAAGTNFLSAWSNCSSLTSFPAGFFDSWSPTSVSNQCFYDTWDGCTSLTPASVVNILDSIAASGQSAPSGTGTNDKKITIDWDGTGDPATDAAAAITTLKSRNWQIYLNNVLQ